MNFTNSFFTKERKSVLHIIPTGIVKKKHMVCDYVFTNNFNLQWSSTTLCEKKGQAEREKGNGEDRK